MNFIWEGAELIAYVNGRTLSVSLSDMQFDVIAKLLGLKYFPDGHVLCYSDETLERLENAKGNPLRFKEID